MRFKEVQNSGRPRTAIEEVWEGAPGASSAGWHNVYVMAELLGTGLASANEVTQVPFGDADDAADWFGAGSFGDYMCRQVFRGGGLKSAVYGVALTEAAGVAAKQTYTFATTATSDGKFTLNVAGNIIVVQIESGDDITAAGAEMVAEHGRIDSGEKAPVTPVNAVGIVTATANNKGAHGNTFPSYQIVTGEEPTGMTVVVGDVVFDSGTLYPTITTALANMEQVVTPVIVHPWDEPSDGSTKTADLIRIHLVTKCDAEHMMHGFQVYSQTPTVALAVTEAETHDDDNAERSRFAPICLNTATNSPGSWHGAAAAYCANALARQLDPAYPYYNVGLSYMIKPPDDSDVLTNTEVDTLLNAGVTPLNWSADRQKYQLVRGVNVRLINTKFQDWGIVDAIDWYRHNVDVNLKATFPPGTKLAEDGETNLDENTTTPAGVLDVFYETLFSEQMRGVLRNRETLWEQAYAEVDATLEGQVNVSVAVAAMMGLAVIAGKIRQIGGVIGN